MESRYKSEEELTAQLDAAEQGLGEPLVPENERQEALTLPLAELQERYPEEYKKYLHQLRIGGKQVESADDTARQSYTNEELEAVRSALAGEANLSEQLREKLSHDENVKQYSFAYFFPGIHERIEKGEKPEAYVLPTGGRQRALKIAFPDRAYAVKTLENSKEREIAVIAAELNLGPKQYETIKNHLVEQFIEGSLIAKLKPEVCTPEFMEKLGIQIGTGIKKMHERNIVINDQLLRDDIGKCHTIVTEFGDARFIDFGAAVDLANYPNLTEEQFWLLMRSDPWASMGTYGLPEDKLSEAIKSYGQNLVNQFPDKDSLMKARDYQLMNEGLSFISENLPNVEYLAKGIKVAL